MLLNVPRVRLRVLAGVGARASAVRGVMMLHVVTAGQCWLEVEGANSCQVRPGDCVGPARRGPSSGRGRGSYLDDGRRDVSRESDSDFVRSVETTCRPRQQGLAVDNLRLRRSERIEVLHWEFGAGGAVWILPRKSDESAVRSTRTWPNFAYRSRYRYLYGPTRVVVLTDDLAIRCVDLDTQCGHDHAHTGHRSQKMC